MGASAQHLVEDLASMPGPTWSATVVTAQGRTMPATYVPWLRAREVCGHTVDGFCRALVRDVVRWRSARPGPAVALIVDGEAHELAGAGPVHRIELALPDAAAWLTGRRTRPDLPELPSWM